MKHNKYLVICALLFSLIAASCKKGDPGTANVTYSAWFTPEKYTKDTVFGIWGFNYNKAAPAITQQILDSAAVLTFGKLEGYNPPAWSAGQVAQLPVTLTYKLGTTPTYDTWTALATVGNLKIRFVNDQNYYNGISVAHKFRYVIIPGAQKDARQRQLSYEEICRKYNIPE